MNYRAVRKCQYGSKIYRDGDVLVFGGEVIPCENCKGTGEVKGAMCPKCKGTKRINPPHHFMPIDPDAELKQVVAQQESEAEQIETIRKEFDAIGAAYDRRWKLARMKTELIAAKKSGRGE